MGEDKVVCMICGAELGHISNLHTQKHGLSVAEYRKLFPNAPIRSKTAARKQSRSLSKTWNKKREEWKESIKKGWTEEKRKAVSERLKKLYTDPEFKKRATRGIISEAKSERGRERRRKMCLENNPNNDPEVRMKKSLKMKGRMPKCAKMPRTPEWRKKISESLKGERNPFYGKTHTEDVRLRLSALMRGENNPAWRGGLSYIGYCTFEFDDWIKEQIRKRDGYRCRLCGASQDELGYRLHVHHIDGDKKNNNPNNLVSLCRRCHGLAHWYPNLNQVLRATINNAAFNESENQNKS